MTVNISSSPYYDDYVEDKNYQRILFKPGVSLQSRELNQIQSILHNSISRTAGGIYGENSRITDDPSSVIILDRRRGQDIFSVKLRGDGVNVYNYIGKYLTGSSTNTIGKIKFAYKKDEGTAGDPAVLVIQVERSDGPLEFGSEEVVRIYNNIDDAYIKNNNFVASEITLNNTFITASALISAGNDEITLLSKSNPIIVGDELVFPSLDYGKDLYVTKVISDNNYKLNDTVKRDVTTGISFTFQRKNTVRTSIVTVSSGTYYKRGYFTKIKSQSVVPDKFTDFPTKSIILRYSELLVDYTTDDTLLDPAFESSNYLAPGADRFKTELTISSVDITSNNQPDTTDDYIEVVRFIEGREEYSENARNYLPVWLNTILAERTYDESGNYEVIPFRLIPKGSSLDGTQAKLNVTKGKAVIGGQFIETSGPTEIRIDKAKTFETSEDIFINVNQDEYIIIDEPSFGYTDPTRVRLYDVLEAHNTTDRSAMSSASLIGYVIIKHIVYDGGDGGNKRYRLYPYWFYQASNTLGIRDIKSLISKNNVFSNLVNNNGTYNSPKFFANVNSAKGLEIVNGNSLMLGYELGPRKRGIFPIDSKYIKSISNIRIYHSKKIENQSVTSSTVTVTLTGTEFFIGNAGTLPVDTKRRYYQMLVKSKSSGSLEAGQPIDVDTIGMSLNADKQALTINLSTFLVTGSIDLYLTIYNSELGRKTKFLNFNVVSEPISINNSNIPYSIYKSDIYALKGIYSIGSNSFHREYNNAVTYAQNNFVSKDGSVYRAVISSTGQSLTDTSYWEKIPKELESLYSFDDGQYDTHYDLASITYKGNLSIYNPGNVVVIVDNFSHSGTGVIDFTSYPILVQNNIPVYRSENGTVFNLRNCLDFRPKKNDTNVAANFWADNNSNTFLLPNPVLENALQLNFEYYLPRIDRLYLLNKASSKDNKSFNFFVDKGIPSVSPSPPLNTQNKDKLLLATLIIPPFTRNSSDIKIFYNKSPRYTMRDISILDNRLTVLEKKVKKQGLDIIALNNQIFDGGNTANLLFKTGILVDDFSSLSTNDIKQPHSTCTIDPINKELKPSISAVSHNLFFETKPDLDVNYDLVTFKILSEESLVSVTETTIDKLPDTPTTPKVEEISSSTNTQSTYLPKVTVPTATPSDRKVTVSITDGPPGAIFTYKFSDIAGLLNQGSGNLDNIGSASVTIDLQIIEGQAASWEVLISYQGNASFYTFTGFIAKFNSLAVTPSDIDPNPNSVKSIGDGYLSSAVITTSDLGTNNNSGSSGGGEIFCRFNDTNSRLNDSTSSQVSSLTSGGDASVITSQIGSESVGSLLVIQGVATFDSLQNDTSATSAVIQNQTSIVSTENLSGDRITEVDGSVVSGSAIDSVIVAFSEIISTQVS